MTGVVDAKVLVEQVAHAGRTLPEPLRRQVLAAAPGVLPPLISLLADEALSMEDAPGEGYGPIHAAELLCDLRPPPRPRSRCSGCSRPPNP